MQTGNSIQDYFKKRSSAISELLKKPPGRFSAEDYHRLRVEIKKVRAVMTMPCDGVKKEKLKKLLKPARKLFKQAGKVRTVQLETSILKKYDPRHKLKLFLHQRQLQELKLKKEFSRVHHRKKDGLKKSLEIFLCKTKKIKKEDALAFLDREKKEITGIARYKKLEPAHVHELRKRIKKLYYNIKSLGMNKKGLGIKNGNRLLDVIGKWHDCELMSAHLAKDIKEKIF